MLEGVISSKTKISILVRLFLNPATRAYLRELSKEFDLSTNSVRTELNTLTKHKILVRHREGRQIYYGANIGHPLFPELSSMVRKITGIDALIHSVVDRLGRLESVFLTGDYAKGRDSGIIDIILVGEVDRTQLEDVIRKTERYIDRKIRTLVLTDVEFARLHERGYGEPIALLWQAKS